MYSMKLTLENVLIVACAYMPPNKEKQKIIMGQLNVLLASLDRAYNVEIAIYTNMADIVSRYLNHNHRTFRKTIHSLWNREDEKEGSLITRQIIDDFRYAFAKIDVLQTTSKLIDTNKYRTLVITDIDAIFMRSSSIYKYLKIAEERVCAVDYGMQFDRDMSILYENDIFRDRNMQKYLIHAKKNRWINSGLLLIPSRSLGGISRDINEIVDTVINASAGIKKQLNHYSDEVLFNIVLPRYRPYLFSNQSNNSPAIFFWTIPTKTESRSPHFSYNTIFHIHLPDIKISYTRLCFYRFIFDTVSSIMLKFLVFTSLSVEYCLYRSYIMQKIHRLLRMKSDR